MCTLIKKKGVDVMTTIIVLKIENRKETSKEVQSVLTDFGCEIRTRLGINDYKEEECSYTGLILIDVPNSLKATEMIKKIKEIKNVTIKFIEI